MDKRVWMQVDDAQPSRPRRFAVYRALSGWSCTQVADDLTQEGAMAIVDAFVVAGYRRTDLKNWTKDCVCPDDPCKAHPPSRRDVNRRTVR